MSTLANDTTGLNKAIAFAERALQSERRATSPLHRYLRLKELAEYPLLDEGVPGGLTDRLKSTFRRAALAGQAQYNDDVLRFLRDEVGAGQGAARSRRLLYLAPFDVLSRNGGAARVLGLAEALGEQFDVTVISVVGAGREPDCLSLTPAARVLFAPVTLEFQREVDAGRSRFAGAAFSLALCREWRKVPLLHFWVSDLASRTDACILNQPYLIDLWDSCRSRARLVYDVPEVNRFFTLRMAEGGSDTATVTRMQQEAEAKTLDQAAIVGMCSESDAQLLRDQYPAWPAERLALIPNGVNAADCVHVPPSRSRRLKDCCGYAPQIACFLGSPGYPPNQHAVSFIREQLAVRRPDVTFVIIGMTEADAGPAASPSNLVFCGRVSEHAKSAILGISDLALAPMKYDSGSSLKIPDYISHGKPVLTTEHGLRGFEALRPHLELQNLDAFPAALDRLCGRIKENPGSCDRLVESSRACVMKHYDWSVIGAGYAERIRSALV